MGGSTVAAIDTTDYYFSSQNFCAFTCHVMESTTYQELQQSKHWKTSSGVRPTCADDAKRRLSFAEIRYFRFANR